MALTDSDGNLIETYEYDVFGIPDITQNGATNNRFLFAGYGWDPDTGLYNYDDVAYNPFIGRLLQGGTIFLNPLGTGEEQPGYGPPEEPRPWLNEDVVDPMRQLGYIPTNPYSPSGYHGRMPQTVPLLGEDEEPKPGPCPLRPGTMEFTLWWEIGGLASRYGLAFGVYDIEIWEGKSCFPGEDPSPDDKCMYRVWLIGLGLGTPDINFLTESVGFTTGECKDCSEFGGVGYVGGMSAKMGYGVSYGGGIKIPNGPFIPGDQFQLTSGAGVGVSHCLAIFDFVSKY